jgi:hypothetical protein
MAAPFALEGRTALIGQRETCDVALRSTAVSTAHALVFELNGRHFIRDLGSRTGTFVNGRQVHQEALEIGDMVRIGETALRYASAARAEAVDVGEDEDDLIAAQARAAAVPVAGEAAAEELAALEPVPVSAVVPVEEPGQEEFHDLGFAADGLEPAAEAGAEIPIAGDEPPAVGELTGTVGETDDGPPAVVSMPIESLGSETEWRPGAPATPEEPAEQVATMHPWTRYR